MTLVGLASSARRVLARLCVHSCSMDEFERAGSMPKPWNAELLLNNIGSLHQMIRTMALRRMAASLLSRSLATSQLVPQAATLRQCSLLHAPAQQAWNAWTPAVASGRICEAARAFSSDATSAVVDAIAAEIEFEKEDYAPPPVRCRHREARPLKGPVRDVQCTRGR